MIVLIENSKNERINSQFEDQPKVSRQKRSLSLFKSFMDSMFKTKSKTKYLVDDEENIVNVVKVLLIIRLFVNNG